MKITLKYFFLGLLLLKFWSNCYWKNLKNISLEDKSIYPKKLDFLNKLAMKLYSDKKTSDKVITIAILIGATIGFVIGFIQSCKNSI